MSEKLSRLVDAVGAANRERLEHLDRTASMRRARFIAAAHQPPPRRMTWWVAGVAAAAAAGLVLLFMLPAAQLELTIDGDAAGAAAMIAAGEDPVEVEFSDGTRMRALPGARLHVATQEHGAAIALSSGTLQMTVTPRPDARWVVHAGPYAVEVVGTEFSAAWSAGQLVVEVREGEVCARGPDVDRCVQGGERLVAGEPSGDVARAEVETPATTTAAGDPQAEHVEEPRGGAATSGAPRGPERGRERSGARRPSTARWAELAARGDYDAAFEAAAVGGFAARCRRAGRSQLEELADLARFAGKTDAARDALKQLRARFPGSAGGRRAAYRLGRLEFEQARRYREAARWFELYLKESPRGVLAQAALGRLVESLDRGGQQARSRRAAQRYLDRYPSGAHADIARAVLASRP